MDTNSGLFKMKKFAADAGTLFNRAVQVMFLYKVSIDFRRKNEPKMSFFYRENTHIRLKRRIFFILKNLRRVQCHTMDDSEH